MVKNTYVEATVPFIIQAKLTFKAAKQAGRDEHKQATQKKFRKDFLSDNNRGEEREEKRKQRWLHKRSKGYS